MSMVTKEQLKRKIDYIPDEYLALLAHIMEAFEQNKPSLPASPIMDWTQFVEETYGSLRDAPLERGVQGEYETRETLA